MTMLPAAAEQLIAELTKLPGIGRRSAERIAFDLLSHLPERPAGLEGALHRLGESVGRCAVCGMFTEEDRCLVCADRSRDPAILCVVESAVDAISLDRAFAHRVPFHVLGGRLSPIRGVTPKQLRFEQLYLRLKDTAIGEVILAMSPSVEGEATAHYLARELAPAGIRLTRIGRGISMGASLENADAETLRLSVEHRQPVSL